MNRELIVKSKGNSYTVSFPTAGQYKNIEVYKSILTKNQYGSMSTNFTNQSIRTLDMVDAIAYITILMPDFVNDSKVNDLEELDIMDMMDLMDEVYVKQLKPFIDGWEKILSERSKKSNNETKKKEASPESSSE